MEEIIVKSYNLAKKKYEEFGINTEEILNKLKNIALSIHCWQGDDVGGFEKPNSELSGGGILATGNFPGKARTIKDLQQDLEKVISLIPGNHHRINLQSSYGDFGGKFIERNNFKPEYYQGWINWAKKNNLKIDFNSTLFSHPYAEDGFTLSSKIKIL